MLVFCADNFYFLLSFIFSDHKNEIWLHGIKTGIWELFKEDSTRYLNIEYDSEGQEIKYNGVKIQYGRRFRE